MVTGNAKASISRGTDHVAETALAGYFPPLLPGKVILAVACSVTLAVIVPVRYPSSADRSSMLPLVKMWPVTFLKKEMSRNLCGK
jgi:hypothetical protein